MFRTLTSTAGGSSPPPVAARSTTSSTSSRVVTPPSPPPVRPVTRGRTIAVTTATTTGATNIASFFSSEISRHCCLVRSNGTGHLRRGAIGRRPLCTHRRVRARSGRGADELVADAPDVQDVRGLGAVVQLAAQAARMGVERARPAARLKAPDVTEKLVLQEDALGLRGERRQQVVLLRREVHAAAGDADDTCG